MTFHSRRWRGFVTLLAILALVSLVPLSAMGRPAVDGDGDPVDRGFKSILPTERDENEPAHGVPVTAGRHTMSELPAEAQAHLRGRKPPAPPKAPKGAPSSSLLLAPGYSGYDYKNTVLGIRGDYSAVLSWIPTNDGTNPDALPATVHPWAACIEAGFLTWDVTSQTIYHWYFSYDWCNVGVQYHVVWDTTDTTWRTKYTSVGTWQSMTQNTTYQDKTIHTRIWFTGQSPFCTELDLWNYQTGAYDVGDTICGNPSEEAIAAWGFWESNQWDYTTYPTCNALGAYNVAGGRNLFKRSSSGVWSQIVVNDVLNEWLFSGHPADNPNPVICIGPGYTYNYYGRNDVWGGTYSGADFVVCGPDANRTASNVVCT